jgi:hypothetical protein
VSLTTDRSFRVFSDLNEAQGALLQSMPQS